MKRKTTAVIIAFVLLLGKTAFAHRIDEYLQATILSVKANRVQASMRLIPGMLVSSFVIAAIDSNGDGVSSEGEERAYAQHVLGDLSITIDGQNIRPQAHLMELSAAGALAQRAMTTEMAQFVE
jgi:hypothetical protein